MDQDKKQIKSLTVKYDNELNRVAFHRLNAKEIDLFFTLAAKLKEKKLAKLSLSFNELKKTIKFEPTSKDRFVTVVDNLNRKMLSFTLKSDDGNVIENYVLFTGYKINREKKELEVSVNPELMYLVNDLTRGYTLFEQQELVSIKSTYAKNCYRLLKQYRSTGFFKISIIDFRNILDIPSSYNMSDINKRVLTRIKTELSNLFSNLSIKKIKSGTVITFLEFAFDKQSGQKISQPVTEVNKKQSELKINPMAQNDINKILKDFDNLDQEESEWEDDEDEAIVWN